MFPINTSPQRVIPALDMPWDQAGSFVEQMLKLGIENFKVGLVAQHAVGSRQTTQDVIKWGGHVLLDAKLHDTSGTIGKSVAAIRENGASAIILHAPCSAKALTAAKESAGECGLFAVTVLTDLAPDEVKEIYGIPTEKMVLKLALLAYDHSLNGVICSPLELSTLQKTTETQQLIKVTPGIRPVWAQAGQQARFTTPQQAMEWGAKALVIGSPLYNPPPEIGTPTEAAKLILDEVDKGTRHLRM